MPTSILVEDGTGVTGSNSYVTEQAVANYCKLRGVALATDMTLLDPYIIAATDYLESQCFIGTKVYADAMEWPRRTYGYVYSSTNVYLDGVTIPTKLKLAQCQLVLEQLRGITLNASQASVGSGNGFASPLLDGSEVEAADSRYTKRERVEGAIDVEYSETITPGLTPYMPLVDKYLNDLICNSRYVVTR